MKKISGRLVFFAKQNLLSVILIVVAAVLHLAIILPSGSHYCFGGHCGDYFWGVHEHDAIWHMAVAESAFSAFPPRNPIFSGSSLSGYNSFLDFFLFIFKLGGISPLFTYFKILPIVWFVLFTFISVKLSQAWSKKPFFTFIFLFLNYFGASFSFLIPLIKEKVVTGSSSLLSMQAILTLTNVQLAFSYVFLLWIILILLENKITKKNIILLYVFLFLQWGLKFYTGVISSVLIGVFFLLRFVKLKEKRQLIPLLLFAATSMASIYVNYNPFGGTVGSVLIFKPLALLWPIVEDRGLLYSEYWANAKYVFLASSWPGPRFLIFMCVLILLFIFLNFGYRILGLISLVRHQFTKERRDIHISLGLAILIGTLLPIIFIQKGMWWNTIQFLYPTFVLLNIYSADFVNNIKNKAVQYLLLSLIIVLSLPYLTDALKGYLIYPGEMNISTEEIHALGYLKKLPDGVVYAPLYQSNNALNKNNSKPLFSHVDSAYISAYSGKQTLYANFIQLTLLSIDHEGRKKQIIGGNCTLTSKIQYAYIPISQSKDLFFRKCIYDNGKFRQIYKNTSALIYSKIK